MNEPDKITNEEASTGPAIDIAIRIGLIALLIVLCFKILKPFISLVIWGTILAIAFYPLCRKLSGALGGRVKLSAAIITVVTLLVIILPSIRMVSSLVDGTRYINDRIQRSEFKVPPPPVSIDT